MAKNPQLNDFIQGMVNVVGEKLNKYGYINASNLISETQKIVTSEDAKKQIEALLTTTDNGAVIVIPETMSGLRVNAIVGHQSAFKKVHSLPQNFYTTNPKCMEYVEIMTTEPTYIGGAVSTSSFDAIISGVCFNGDVIIKDNDNHKIGGMLELKNYSGRDAARIPPFYNIYVQEGITSFASPVFSFSFVKHISNFDTRPCIHIPSTLKTYKYEVCEIGSDYKSALFDLHVDMSFNDFMNNVGNENGTTSSSGVRFFCNGLFWCADKTYFKGEPAPKEVVITSNKKQLFGGLNNMEKVVIKKGYVTFGDCPDLKEAVYDYEFSDYMIYNYAFYRCPLLEKVTIKSSSIKTLKECCFQGCEKLTFIEIPSTITTIEKNCLQIGNSTNKATIRFLGTTPPTIQTSTFNKNYLNKIIVPTGTSSTYKTATNWSSFADYIIENSNATVQVESSLLNNELITYSFDNDNLSQFTSESFTKNLVGMIKIVNNSSKTIYVGTTEGGSEIGSVGENGTLTYTFTSDTTIYITEQ